jgi:hypothetical protein
MSVEEYAAVCGEASADGATVVEAGCIDDENVGVTPSEDTGPAPSESEEIDENVGVTPSEDTGPAPSESEEIDENVGVTPSEDTGPAPSESEEIDENVGVTPSEDTGPAPSESEEIDVGFSVSGSLSEPEETDRFHFQAEAGEYYLIDVNWQDIPRLSLRLFQVPGYNWTFDYSSSPISERWTPDVSGTINISVSAWGETGTYVLSILPDPSPRVPTNLRASWEGTGVRLSWDPAAGAEYYNIYRSSVSWPCETTRSGQASGSTCSQLAANITATTYTHASVDEEENRYWVAACNSGGCSQISAQDSAVVTADQPGGPRSAGPCLRYIDLEPGDTCAVYASSGHADAIIFEVREGEACYGDICSAEEINEDEFSASHWRFWEIIRLPEGHEREANATASP